VGASHRSLRQSAVVEFAVEDDRVRRWCYRIPALPEVVGDSLLDVATRFYVPTLGRPHSEEAPDVDYFTKYRGWCVPGMSLGVHAFIGPLAGGYTLAIGIQGPCPHGP
jgi:hypothetical protein